MYFCIIFSKAKVSLFRLFRFTPVDTEETVPTFSFLYAFTLGVTLYIKSALLFSTSLSLSFSLRMANWLTFALSPMEMMKSPDHTHFVSYDDSSTPYLIDNLYGKKFLPFFSR